MSRYLTGTRRAWTDSDTAWAVSMSDADVSPVHIARTLNRTISSVENKLRLVRAGELLGPGMARYEAPTPVESDDARHLARIAHANDGYGFPVVTGPLLNRLYMFEASPPRLRDFWRGA